MKIFDLYTLEDLLTDDEIKSICQPGSNDNAVKEVTDFLENQILVNDTLIRQCEEYGTDLDTSNERAVKEFAIWCASWNKFERDAEGEIE